jgi:hypothetical protein
MTSGFWARRGWPAATIGLGMVMLGACAQPVPPGAPECSPHAAPVATGVRMLLSFREPVEGDDPPFVDALQRHAQACVRHVTRVSPTVHVYLFTGVTDATLLRQRLLDWPLVRDAVPDARLKAH